jgi:hypothetical protein
MTTSRSTWKAAERSAAALFGCLRKPCSGSGGRTDVTSSDSTHDVLYIETKLRQRHTTRTLHDDVRRKARGEAKTPVLVLRDKGKPGQLVVVHSGDMDTVLVERVRCLLGDQEADFLSQKLSRARPGPDDPEHLAVVPHRGSLVEQAEVP